jgi:TldD protein
MGVGESQNVAVPVDAREFFFEQLGIQERWLEENVGRALCRRADDADLYFEHRTIESVSLEDGLVKTATRHVQQGVGARVVVGDRVGYAHTDDVSFESVCLASRAAEYIALESGESRSIAVRVERPPHQLYRLKEPPIVVPPQEKVHLLSRVDEVARGFDQRIRNVLASIVVEHKVILIARADGLVVGDVQPLLRMQVTCIAEDRGSRQQGSFGGGGRVEFAFLTEGDRYLTYARKAAEQAVRNLSATDAPAGEMVVVLGPGWPGILLHEAVGHGLEGDFNRKGVSAFAGRLGEVVASPACTVVDDGTIPNRRGSLNVDDEGTPTSRTVLIENGVLRGYLQDRLNARLMGMRPTGNGRRESFAHMPLPRMTNTFLLPGEYTPEEIIRSVQRGLYAAYFGGGQVDITSGKFVFSASEAFLIEDGRLTRPVKGATLIGHGPEVLKRVTMVGNDLQLDEGIGTCGKDGQSVPVGVGLPTVRVDGLTVGGTRPAS